MKIKIWGILEGPIHVSDYHEVLEAPEGSEYFMSCKVEIDGNLESNNFWFEDLNDTYEWINHFNTTVDPLIIDTGSNHEYN
tara:strand:+ start:99 stop:341 length:243 start_codon:yes stop_codon:yes gene_type:complete